MDARLFRALAAVALLLAAAPTTAQSVPPSEGGDYRLVRVRVAAGTSEAHSLESGIPRYRLQATAGQAEADPHTGTSSHYRLRGGFWNAASEPMAVDVFSDGFED